MATNRTWRQAALENYKRRCVRVPAKDDALLDAVEAAGPGVTLNIDPGVHRLSREVAITVPIKLIGPKDGREAAVLYGEHVVLRTRAEAWLEGLTFCRMGTSPGYPNAVVFAEAGRLKVEGCRITCGGAASSIDDALRTFQALPSPGQPIVPEQSADQPATNLADTLSANISLQDDPTQDRPQSGLWIGAASQVSLRSSIIAGTMGPGVKVYRGELEAVSNTIAFSLRGANVVANGGRMVLCDNRIQGATGDGISSWNNTHMTIEGNHICDNSGSGITINSTGGTVHISEDNEFRDNGTADIHRPSTPRPQMAQLLRPRHQPSQVGLSD